MKENIYFRDRMRSIKLYILLTTVLLLVTSAVFGFCGLGGAVADYIAEREEPSIVEESLSSASGEGRGLVSELFFELAAESLTNFASVSSSNGFKVRASVRRETTSFSCGNLLAHFIHHKYFNHASLPFIYEMEPSENRHYLQFLRVLII